MKNVAVGALVLALMSCASTQSRLSDYFFLHGAVLEEGPMERPMRYTLTAPTGNSLALRRGDPYTKIMRCEFSLQRAVHDGPMNGFLVFADSEVPEAVVTAGVYIGGGEYAIEGPGVREPIIVAADFDRSGVFKISILVDFERGFIEMKTPEREISTGLAPQVTQFDTIGYAAKETRTRFSEVRIVGE